MKLEEEIKTKLRAKIAKDIRGTIIEKDDWCWFWNNSSVRVKYQFYELYHRDNGLYISIDKNDDNDLSWWKNCEKIVVKDEE